MRRRTRRFFWFVFNLSSFLDSLPFLTDGSSKFDRSLALPKRSGCSCWRMPRRCSFGQVKPTSSAIKARVMRTDPLIFAAPKRPVSTSCFSCCVLHPRFVLHVCRLLYRCYFVVRSTTSAHCQVRRRVQTHTSLHFDRDAAFRRARPIKSSHREFRLLTLLLKISTSNV